MSKVSNGLVHIRSQHNVTTTITKLENILIEKGMKIIAKVDHSAAAANIGEDLSTTTLLLFGNPQTGTPLMQEQQLAGIDLPQKALIWADEDNQTWISYNNPMYLAERHQLHNQNALIEKITAALSNIMQSAAE